MDSEGSGAVAPYTLMGCRVTTCACLKDTFVDVQHSNGLSTQEADLNLRPVRPQHAGT